MKKETKNRPLVLVPQGPYGWASHRYILPELLKIWESLGCDFMKLWMPGHRWRFDELQKVSKAPVLIFPLGHNHYSSFDLLKHLRHQFGIETPACIMYTSDIAKRMQYLMKARGVVFRKDWIVVNSSPEKELLKAFYPRLNIPVLSQPLPLDEDVFYYQAGRNKVLKRKLQLPEDKKVILYAGRISKQKNIADLMRVFRTILNEDPNVYLLCIGAIDDLGTPHFKKKEPRYIQEISDCVTALSLENDIEFRPFQSQKELANYLRACDVHVSLSAHSGEDFGYTLAQGLAMGVPTVVTRWGGQADLEPYTYQVPVTLSADGPEVNLSEARKKILSALNSNHNRVRASKFLEKYGCRAIQRSWKKMLEIQLETGKSSNELAKIQVSIKARNGLAFKSALDPEFKKFFQIYTRKMKGKK